jgi:hypothetical protein
MRIRWAGLLLLGTVSACGFFGDKDDDADAGVDVGVDVGALRHYCAGCAPELVAENPGRGVYDLRLTDSEVYWVFSEAGVAHVPKTGGSPVFVFYSPAVTQSLAVTDEAQYFVKRDMGTWENTLIRRPFDGMPDQILGTFRPDVMYTGQIAVNSHNVFVAAYDFILVSDKVGPAKQVAQWVYGPPLVADESGAYFASNDLSGPGIHLERLSADGERTVVASWTLDFRRSVDVAALDSGTVFLGLQATGDDDPLLGVTFPDNEIMSVPTAGGSAVLVSKSVGRVRHLAVDATHVYWLVQPDRILQIDGESYILRAPREGGPAGVVVHLKGYYASSIAVDATHLYWNEGELFAPYASVLMRMPKPPPGAALEPPPAE